MSSKFDVCDIDVDIAFFDSSYSGMGKATDYEKKPTVASSSSRKEPSHAPNTYLRKVKGRWDAIDTKYMNEMKKVTILPTRVGCEETLTELNLTKLPLIFSRR